MTGRTRGGALALLALAAAGCQESAGPRKITQSREITVAPGEDFIGATSKDRFPDMMSSMGGPHGGGPQGENDIAFDWTMPEGWSQLPTRQMHLLDMKAGPDPDVECSLSIAGGSLLDNVNRWRKQFGQAPVEAASLENLPKQALLQREAVRVEVEGAYAGMGKGAAKEGYKLIGLVAGNDEQQVFVKMTGPKAAVEKQAAALASFAASLRVKQDEPAAHGGGAHGGMGAGDVAEGFDYALPTGWTQQKPDPNRLVNLRPADDPEMDCYLSIARGGVLPNVNRWRGQFGAPPIDDAELAKLPTLPLFGVNAVRVEVDGTFRTMSGEQRDGYQLLGLVAEAAGQQIFVKMTGPKEKVEKERAGFVAFATSLKWKGGAPNGSDPGAAGAGGGAAPAGGAGDDSGVQYVAPASWKKLPARPMRLATFAIGDSKLTECTLIQLGGDGGGVAQNVNRWRDQMGLGAAKPSELLQLPTLEVLGVEAPLVDLTGHFKDSMAKRDVDHARFLGLIATTGDGTIFVKLTGPEAEVAAAFEDFRAFCQSLRK